MKHLNFDRSLFYKTHLSKLIVGLALAAFFYELYMPVNGVKVLLGQILDWLIVILVVLNLVGLIQRKAFYGISRLFLLLLGALMLFYFYTFVDRKLLDHHIMPFVGGYHLATIAQALLIIAFLRHKGNKHSKNYIVQLILRPAHTMGISFLVVAFLGSIILTMPSMHVKGVHVAYIDSLFTALSATCITGLVTVSIIGNYSFIGQIMILILTQLGGIGIMLISYVVFSRRHHLSIHGKAMLSYMLNDDAVISIKKVAVQIITTILAIEAIGALFFYIGLAKYSGKNLHTLFSAIFHSVMSFCNAGFSLYSHSFSFFQNDTLLCITTMSLIFLGGLGFIVIINLTQYTKWSFLNLFKKHTKRTIQKLSLNTVISVRAMLALFFIGFMLFYFIEHDNLLYNLSLKEQYLVAVFQSVTMRTAGFDIININRMKNSSYLITLFFMFIGGASGGMAGGVKVTTVLVAQAGLVSFIRNHPRAEIGAYTISPNDVKKAYIVILMSMVAIFIGVLLLSLIEPFSLHLIIFEVISAFSTTGLSLGLTPKLSVLGKILIMILMFLGRLGPLTIFIIAQERIRKNKHHKVDYPEEQVMIG